jgi:hypothetical protein
MDPAALLVYGSTLELKTFAHFRMQLHALYLAA